MRQPGDVFDYPFLWAVEAERGIENPKDRRTTIAAATRRERASDGADITHLILLGITDTPRPDQSALPVPPIERRRAGLAIDRPAFVIVSEYDYDLVPGSHDYNPNSKTYGRFSAAFLDEIQKALGEQMRLKRAARIDRIDAANPRR
jgi:hypothetical protein